MGGTTSAGASVRLHLVYREYPDAGAYGEDVRVLEYSGYFSDGAGAADTVRTRWGTARPSYSIVFRTACDTAF